MYLRNIVFGVLALLACCGPARAEITLRRLAIDGTPPIILVKGEFGRFDSPDVLAREVAASGAKLVTFDSNGGNVLAAIAYGRRIRSLGLSTFQLRAAQCASACTLAFVGGVVRQAEPGAIGVHQTSFSPGTDIDGQAAVAAVQSMTAQIMTYLIEMDVDPKLLQLSLSVPSDDMRYLTASEMQTYGVTSGSLKDLPGNLASASAAQPAPIAPAQSATVAPVGAPEAPPPTPEQKALTSTTAYYAEWSQGNEEALAFLVRAYGDTVDFYGTPTEKAKIIGDKHDFAARWPTRAYSVKFNSAHIVCTDICKVDGVVDWYAMRDSGDRVSSGTAEFSLAWDHAGTLVSELGKVIDTDKAATQPVRLISQWQDDNSSCRGGSGDSPDTIAACSRREAVGSKLQAVGWCHGREGEYGYQMDWHACGSPASPSAVTAETASANSAALRPKASDFPAEGRFAGSTVFSDFKGRDRAFNSFRTRIRDGLREGPNFAGHFSLIQFGCGTGCSSVIVADNNTGRPVDFPRGGESNMNLELVFSRDSRLLTTQWLNYEAGRCFLEYFDFRNGAWNSLGKRDIGDADACYKEISENVH